VGISDAAVQPLDPELENIMSDKKKTGGAFALAQRLGRSLMLPIATLPAAGLLLRLGQADMLGAEGLAGIRAETIIAFIDATDGCLYFT